MKKLFSKRGTQMGVAAFFIIFVFLSSFSSAEAISNAVLEVTHITNRQASPAPDNTFLNGFKWKFDVTVPEAETVLQMKFSDFVKEENIIPVSGNARFYSSQSVDKFDASHSISIASADQYGVVMNLDPLSDLNPEIAGRQIEIIVEVKIPENTPLGAYSASFGIKSEIANEDNDTLPPTISSHENITVEAATSLGAEVAFNNPTATDNVNTVVATCFPLSGSVFPLGKTMVNCRSSDTTGNTAFSQFEITVKDTTAPSLFLLGDNPQVITQGNPYVELGATASDLVDENLQITINSSNVNTAIAGTYSVTYTVTDASLNSSSTTRTVVVNRGLDVTPPVITEHANIIYGDIYQGEHVTATGAVISYAPPTATDDIDGEVAVSCSPTSGSQFTLGFTTVTCSASDTSGNEATSNFTVNVRDEEAPHITVNGDFEMFVYEGDAFEDPGATAIDNVDGPVTVSVSGSVNTSVAGDYQIIYSASDSATPPNTSSTARTIHVGLSSDSIISASAGFGGFITPSGLVFVHQGENRTFTITPFDTYKIEDVLVNGNSIGAVGTYTFTNVTGDQNISATFTSILTNTHTISATAGVGGTISPSGSVLVDNGENQLFTFTRNPSFQILDVVVDGVSKGRIQNYSFNGITENHSISVVFQANTEDPAYLNFETTINEAQAEHDSAVAGTAVGQYPQSAIDAFQDAIDAGKAVWENPLSSRNELIAAHGILIDAWIFTFIDAQIR